ncbi:MAG: hypothetical protein E7372_03390 [Clostridiales bacterium]|nr:hypothetical protein [Clostridiales bacterium]
MEFIKKNLLAIIVAGAAVLALILGIALTPIADVEGEIKLFDIIFGMNESQATPVGTLKMTGGMSITGLISFIALVAGIALTVASIFIKDKNFDFIGAICIAVAGVCMLLLLTVGTDLVYSGAMERTMKFADTYGELDLGIGAILYGVIAILGGAFGILNKFKKIV